MLDCVFTIIHEWKNVPNRAACFFGKTVFAGMIQGDISILRITDDDIKLWHACSKITKINTDIHVFLVPDD